MPVDSGERPIGNASFWHRHFGTPHEFRREDAHEQMLNQPISLNQINSKEYS